MGKGGRDRHQGGTGGPAPAEGEPGDLLAGSVGFLLSKLGFLSASRFGSVLAPMGITPGHFALLRILSAYEGRSQQALGEALAVPPSRMVGLLDDLESRGLVERRRSPTDRRVNALHLTAQGRRTLLRASTVASDWELRLCASLAEEEREELLRLLRRMAADHDMPVGVHPALLDKDASPAAPRGPDDPGGPAGP